MGSHIQRHLSIVWLAVAIHVTLTEAQCYYPGGAWAKNMVPCDEYAFTTFCCPIGWTCFSNNLCIATDPGVVSSELPLGTAMRGTCTNPLWNETACGNFCLNDPVSDNDGSVIPCGNNMWCCQPDISDGLCNCDTGKGTFEIPNGTAQTIIDVFGLQYTSTGSVVPSSAAQSSSASTTISMPSTLSTLSTVTTPTSLTVSSSTSSPTSIQHSSTLTLPTSSSSLSTSVRATSMSTIALATSVLPSNSANQTSQQTPGASDTPVTQTAAFKIGVGVGAGAIAASILGILICLLVPKYRQRNKGTSNVKRISQNPEASATPWQVLPTPHPYIDPQSSTSQSAAALAEQISHNRRTPRPIEIIDENNPYADHYMAGGAGR